MSKNSPIEAHLYNNHTSSRYKIRNSGWKPLSNKCGSNITLINFSTPVVKSSSLGKRKWYIYYGASLHMYIDLYAFMKINKDK